MFSLFRKKEAPPHISAVIAAGGSSSRMLGENKLLCELDDIPVLAHTLFAFEHCAMITEIVVVAKSEEIVPYSQLCQDFGIGKVTQVVSGGSSRTESVYKGIAQVSEGCAFVCVHDAARPLVTPDQIAAVCEDALSFHSAYLAVPVKDTIKVVRDNVTVETLPRDTLYAAQTPQVADRQLLYGALTKVLQERLPITDECSALELIGVKPHVTLGSYENLKITTPEDLLFAEAVIQARREGLS